MSGPDEPQAGRDAGGRSTAAPPPAEGQVTRARDADDVDMDGQAEEEATGEAVGVEHAADAPPASGPDPFRLRARPPQVMRLSRRAVAIIGLGLGLGLGGSLIWALKSAAPKIAPNLYDTASSAKPGVVSGAPTDYSQVTPRLGPRMVGDLGRPFLAAQQRGSSAVGAGSGVQGGNEAVGSGSTPGQAAAFERQQRVRQENDAARSSQLFLGNAGGSRNGAAAVSEQAQAGAPSGMAGLGNTALSTAAVPVPGSQASKRSFMETRSASGVVSREAVTTASSPYVLQAGSIIPAALITGIRSDLPGQITAQVTQNVYDSPTGSLLLIPQGARLIGEYDSQVSAGQNRVLLAWDRLILPGGQSIRLERQPGADVSGMAGLQDKTNYHWGNMMKAAFVSTLLGMGTELVTQDDSTLVQALRYGMQDSINQTGRQLVQRELGVPPTLTVRSGYPLRVIVTRDLIIESVNREK